VGLSEFQAQVKMSLYRSRFEKRIQQPFHSSSLQARCHLVVWSSMPLNVSRQSSGANPAATPWPTPRATSRKSRGQSTAKSRGNPCMTKSQIQGKSRGKSRGCAHFEQRLGGKDEKEERGEGEGGADEKAFKHCLVKYTRF
jgi:hypothetical protein